MNITGTDFNDILIGTADGDVIGGQGGRDWVRGLGGADSISGDAGDDVLWGGNGQDTLLGGEGADVLVGGAGDDTLDGGSEADTVDYSRAPGAVHVDLATGSAQDGQYGTDALTGIEYVRGSRFDDSIQGSAGTDGVSYEDAGGPVVIDLAGGTATGGAGNDTLASIEQAQGSAFSDLLVGTSDNDTLWGGAGEDTLHGGAGDDSLNGGADDPLLGWDWASYLRASGPVDVNLATGLAIGAAGNDTLSNIEGVMGTEFADTLTGDGLDNVLRGNEGNDSIDGGAGDADWVDYAMANGAVAVSLATGTSTGADGNDVFTGIERIGGSQFGDVLTGDAADNRLQGNGGDDTLIGGAGSDGADYRDATGAVGVRLDLGVAGGADGNDTLFGIENIHGSSGFGDALRGDEGSNIIEGRGGNDIIDGAGGLDVAVFSGRFAEYRIVVEVGNFDLVVRGPDGTDRLNNVEVLKFSDRIFVVQQGRELAERLDGTTAGDLLRGREGNDELLGGEGDDAVYGDEGTDTLDGGSGDDVLDGGAGADSMVGGEGNDTYSVDTLDDVVQESEGAVVAAGPSVQDIGSSIDTVVASITYTLGSFIENLTLETGAGGLSGTGNELDNVVEGNESDNLLQGGAGNDTLTGGDGIDTAAYTGPRAEYLVTLEEAGGFRVQGPPADGTDIVDVERLQFADINLALDLEGNAGTVAKILGAVFGADSVGNEGYAGIGLDLADGGMTYESLMQLALDAALGVGASNADMVTLLYTNVVGFAPDEASLAYYTGLIESGAFTQASLGVLAADTTFNQENIDLAGLAETGLEYL
jgi:Ca2+-binding RTX toxin-like protein